GVDGREDRELRVRSLDSDPFFAAIRELAEQFFHQTIAHPGTVALDSQLNPAQWMEAHEGFEIRQPPALVDGDAHRDVRMVGRERMVKKSFDETGETLIGPGDDR